MEALSASDIFLFEEFRLDRRGLFRRDENSVLTPVEIGLRALDVLRVLLERPGDLVTRNEIITAVWPGTVVVDNNLNVQISTLRRALDQEDPQDSCIQTIPGCGYRFVAPVRRVEADPPGVDGPVAAGQRGVARDHEHALEPREIGRQILGNAIDKIRMLLWIVADIDERQHGD